MDQATQTYHPFHLAFPVHDLGLARDFYVNRLGCRVGRSSDHWIDFDLFGHQIVAHQVADRTQNPPRDFSNVDDHQVPVPHFGVVLDWKAWHELADRLRAFQTDFVIPPYIRFEGLPGEQATMFLLDPSGNALEFKAFRDIGQLFAT